MRVRANRGGGRGGAGGGDELSDEQASEAGIEEPVDAFPVRVRPSWDDIFARMALIVAERSSCQRLQVGCLVVSHDFQRVLAFGYNGNYAGGPNQCDDPHTPGQCQCIHAEVNALLKCDNSIKDKIVYTTHSPCVMCAKAIVNSGASAVVYRESYRSRDGIEILEKGGIRCIEGGAG